ncbi:hypothetical protein [Natronomonas amylolytica]|uniref:hypothetical protein n=1 Tax=Natronomonas amylolytica TaxID=3108498 RepID=UPI0030099E22
MVEFTFLEIHLDDSSLTANAPYSHGEKDVVAGDEPPDEDGGSKKGGALAAIIGLVFLAVVAYLAKKKFLDGDEVEEFVDDELDV